jgi:hypothetical protein
MTHKRTLIRHAVRDLLLGLPTTGDRVLIGRTRPLADRYQPTLLIYTVEEIVGRQADDNPADTGRNLQLLIDCRLMAIDPPDDLLDQIEAEVNERMRDTLLDGLAFDVQLARVDQVVKADGKFHEGAARLEYRVRYWLDGEDE